MLSHLARTCKDMDPHQAPDFEKSKRFRRLIRLACLNMFDTTDGTGAGMANRMIYTNQNMYAVCVV